MKGGNLYSFFKEVQNKIHYAIHGQTAAEVNYTRTDSEKEFMGLTTFTGSQSTLKEALQIYRNTYER